MSYLGLLKIAVILEIAVVSESLESLTVTYAEWSEIKKDWESEKNPKAAKDTPIKSQKEIKIRFEQNLTREVHCSTHSDCSSFFFVI